MIYLVFAPVCFISMLVYIQVADRFNIIDHPNERSSHSRVTIRGGGVIFLLAALFIIFFHPAYYLPASGILLIGIISFLDDIYTLSSLTRLLFHVAAVTIMFLYLAVFSTQPVYVALMLYIITIGVINMYNFMDGINGITGAYSLVVLGGLQYINLQQVSFIDPDLLWLPIIATLVFLFFNFRAKAKCFAGDVGSVTMALWIIFLQLSLIFQTHNWVYILFLVVYGIDSVLTIAQRVYLRQNILTAHRLHFYQLLANEKKVSHLVVSLGYALIQGFVIVAIIAFPQIAAANFFIFTIVPLVVVYVLVKPGLMRM